MSLNHLTIQETFKSAGFLVQELILKNKETWLDACERQKFNQIFIVKIISIYSKYYDNMTSTETTYSAGANRGIIKHHMSKNYIDWALLFLLDFFN